MPEEEAAMDDLLGEVFTQEADLPPLEHFGPGAPEQTASSSSSAAPQSAPKRDLETESDAEPPSMKPRLTYSVSTDGVLSSDFAGLGPGWHGPLDNGEMVHVAVNAATMCTGRRVLQPKLYPQRTVYAQAREGEEARLIRFEENYMELPFAQRIALQDKFFRVVCVFLPTSFASQAVRLARHAAEVLEATAPGEGEIAFESDSEDEVKDPDNQKKLTRVQQKALEKEIPWDRIPLHQRPAYLEGDKKEWSDWQKWGAVKVLTKAESDLIRKDPKLRRRILPSRFCRRNKGVAKGTFEPRCRLVVQGFRDPDRHRLRRDSPTASRTGVILVLQLVISKDWDLFGADAKSAFMQGGADLSREDPIYMDQPKGTTLDGCEVGALVQIVGSVYGLVNSPRLWWRVVAGWLVKHGWKMLRTDVSVFAFFDCGRVVAAIAVHVDDLLIGAEHWKYLQDLKAAFTWGDWKRDFLTFCGRQVEYTRGKYILLHQETFASGMEVSSLPRARRQEQKSPLTPNEVSELRSVNGCLQWVGGQTRIDLLANTSLQQGPEPDVETLIKAYSLLKEAKTSSKHGIWLYPVDLEKLYTIVFHDASWANTAGHKSQSGYIVYLGVADALTDKGALCSIVDWRSHRLRRSCQSTLYAEGMGGSEGTINGNWVRRLLLEITLEEYRPTGDDDAYLDIYPLHAVTDNQSLYDVVVGSSLPEDKRAAVEVLTIQEQLGDRPDRLDQDGRFSELLSARRFHWCRDTDQKADILTKMSNGTKRQNFREHQQYVRLRPKVKKEAAGPSRKRVQLPSLSERCT